MTVAFIRVPKTASTALAMALRYRETTGIPYCGGHVTAMELETHTHPHEYVTMVRDPFQLYQSLYYYIRRRNDAGQTPLQYTSADTIATVSLAIGAPTVEDFLADVPKNQMFQYFYAPLKTADFAYVGVDVDLPRSIALLEAVSGINTVTTLDLNTNPDKPMGQNYVTTYDEALFQTQAAQDYDYYNAGLARFNDLCVQHGI